MTSAATTTLHRLLDDRGAGAGRDGGTAVQEHRAHRSAWYAPLVGPLVLSDTVLAATARRLPPDGQLEVAVVVSGGAGGLLALAGRTVPGLRVSRAEATVRDLDDLAGAAGRLVVAAEQLADVEVVVGLPHAPGWVRAVEVVEAAGLRAALAPALLPGQDAGVAARLAEQLSVLVEADLPFTVTWPGADSPGTGPGLATAALLMAVEALVDGADAVDAAELLGRTDPTRARTGLLGWDDGTAARARRRLGSVGTAVPATVDGFVELGLVAEGAAGPGEQPGQPRGSR